MAYGARLESVLGASPQGFESPILRVEESVVPAGVGALFSFGQSDSRRSRGGAAATGSPILRSHIDPYSFLATIQSLGEKLYGVGETVWVDAGAVLNAFRTARR